VPPFAFLHCGRGSQGSKPHRITRSLILKLRSSPRSWKLRYTAYLDEGNDIGGIDVGFLVRRGIAVTLVTQLGADELHLGKGHVKFGCSTGVMENWTAEVQD